MKLKIAKKSKKTLGVKPRHRVQNQALTTLVGVESSYNCTKPASMKDNSEVVVVLLLLLFKFCSFLDSLRCHLEIQPFAKTRFISGSSPSKRWPRYLHTVVIWPLACAASGIVHARDKISLRVLSVSNEKGIFTFPLDLLVTFFLNLQSNLTVVISCLTERQSSFSPLTAELFFRLQDPPNCLHISPSYTPRYQICCFFWHKIKKSGARYKQNLTISQKLMCFR